MLDKVNAETGTPGGRPGSIAGELFPLLLEKEMLSENLGPEHPKVMSLEKQIQITRDFLETHSTEEGSSTPRERPDILTVYMESLRQELDANQQKEQQLNELFKKEEEAAKTLAVYEIKDETYRNDIARTQQLFESVLGRLEEINLVKDYGGYKTQVIVPAGGGYQVEPNFSRIMSMASMFGLMAGVAFAYLLELADKTFRSPEEITQQLGLPIVGHIPVIAGDKKIVNRESKLDPGLVTFFRPKSRLAEAYRAVRTALYFSTRGEQHKVIQVTSPNPGDGKSTLSANLAISIAQSGKKVLLIDADFRRPRVHRLFGLDKTVGMSSVISGQAELPDAIQSTEVENLWSMPCGPRPDNPSELLTNRRFEELLAILREQYDFVLIDTPPVLAVTDPSAVAARVDGVLLTIRISKRTRPEAMRATELLATLGANTLGVVVNGIGGKQKYGYGNSRYGGHRYGQAVRLRVWIRLWIRLRRKQFCQLLHRRRVEPWQEWSARRLPVEHQPEDV